MNKKIIIIILSLLFLNSCGGVADTIQGKKRSEQSDEFLVKKKNPLTMPPDFDELPSPDGKSEKKYQSDNDDIKELINKKDSSTEESNQNLPVEESILKKINE
tara:strand:+ start:5643 stop:5951 length:309 start_codon:yes stop_codon:yes gene_type:complete